jgi:dipeptidase E
MSFRILAFSSSRAGGGKYLGTVAPVTQQFLGSARLQIAFIPFASVGDYDDYGKSVAEGLANMPHQLHVAYPQHAAALIEQCDVVMIGGGNTFKLLHDLYEYNLVELIKTKVQAGIPYIGWSAGSNLTGLSIRTTNDMPILQPPSFTAFGFFPFQINPHYHNEVRTDFHGETRDQRLAEFVMVNPSIPVVCLPEGTWLQAESGKCNFNGNQPGVIMTNENGKVVRAILNSGEVPL